MARNYWDSTQRKLTDKMNSESFRKEHETITSRDIQTAPGLTRDSARHLPMHLTQLLFRCAKTLELHCQVAATATVFLKRFLLRFGLTRWDPRLVAPTCLLLASKVEEYPQKGMGERVAHEWSKLTAAHPSYKYIDKESSVRAHAEKLVDLEFVVVDVVCDSLIVFHPYSALEGLLEDAGQPQLLPHAWSTVNDAFISDVVLLWPPHIVAVASISIAAIMRDVDMRQWQASLKCDTQMVAQVMSEILAMYNVSGNKANFEQKLENTLRSLDTYFSARS